MMPLRILVVICALLSALLPARAAESLTPELTAAPAAGLMHSMGLDRVFATFGHSVAISPRQHGVADERFLAAWEALAVDAFGRSELAAQLQLSLASKLDAADFAGIDAFLLSSLGGRIMGLEAAAQSIPPDRQIAAVAKGQALYITASARRRAQFEELLQLSNAELTFSMLAESIRGMALGLHLSRHGDIDVPWDEIDADVQHQLEGMHESLAEATLGVMAYTYEPLSDAELDDYLSYLRTPAARKFNTTATVTIGSIIRETMFALGADVAAHLNRVDI